MVVKSEAETKDKNEMKNGANIKYIYNMADLYIIFKLNHGLHPK